MKREAFKMFLKPGFEKEYEKRHAAIWPELKKMLSDGGVYDYSIYWDKDTNILFACQKTKGDESSQDMGANPIVQKWWDYMADIMEVNPDNSPVTIPLTFALACIYMKLTVAEAITAITLNGAAALGRADRIGSIEAGKQGDFVLLGTDTPHILPYYTGMNAVKLTIKGGRILNSN